VLGIALVAVSALGFVGFGRAATPGTTPDPITTRVYRTLQLFVLESGAVVGEVPWELEVARFAAPLVAAYAVVQTLVVVFREQVDALRLRWIRDHVVVAGLGVKGSLLAHALLERGDRVVVIDADPANPDLGAVRSAGGLAMIGDARNPAMLRRARIGAASHLAALCGVDAVNAEVVALARDQTRERRAGSLQCVAHLVDPDLCPLLAGEELERYGQAPIRVDFVNVYAAGAQLLVRHLPDGTEHGEPESVTVVGDGLTARHLAVALLHGWAVRERGDGARPVLTVVAAPTGIPGAVTDRGHDRIAEVRTTDDLAAVVDDPLPDVVYVCPDDDTSAVLAGLEVRRALAGRNTKIVVVLERAGGLGRLLENAPSPAGGPSMIVVGLLDEVCRPEVLLAGTTELLARALHETYLAELAGEPADPHDLSRQPWEALPETLRESNRDHAAHVAVKLAAVGHTIGPLVDWAAAQRPFDDRDVEHMARLEHDRWVDERTRQGWTPGPRDPIRRTSPYLVGWEDLADAIRDRDRLFVRRLPQLLASVGLQAHPRDGHPS
jgi:voltage-gated potassium channel Kch